jgi:hypothetical protein
VETSFHVPTNISLTEGPLAIAGTEAQRPNTRASAFKIFIEGEHTRKRALLHRHAVVRRDDLPSAAAFGPDVGEAVVVLVRLAARGAFLMVSARHYCGVAVHVDLQVRKLGDVHVDRRVGAVADVSNLAIGSAVFNRDDKVIGEQLEL